jgi:predicted nucleic acid-binding protein
VKIYFDTGPIIDYLVPRGLIGSGLRSAGRRGRLLTAIFADADRLLDCVFRKHHGATSALTYYEVEEALYKQLRSATKGVANAGELIVPAARAIVYQTDAVLNRFNISVLDLNISTVRAQLGEIELQKRGVRAADALHIATAISFGADVVVTSDDGMLDLDNVLKSVAGTLIRCMDTDAALAIL